ncbi:MAG: hypothetical protein M3P45_05695, partial [Acidobacteriota bacterium]|nr:hypothetical protein [Acidobacteriota bacterium]
MFGHRQCVGFEVVFVNCGSEGIPNYSTPSGASSRATQWLYPASPEGKHLGTIVGAEDPHNIAWGDEDGKTLYLCAKTGLY